VLKQESEPPAEAGRQAAVVVADRQGAARGPGGGVRCGSVSVVVLTLPTGTVRL